MLRSGYVLPLDGGSLRARARNEVRQAMPLARQSLDVGEVASVRLLCC